LVFPIPGGATIQCPAKRVALVISKVAIRFAHPGG
jgi:hypothetical protein